MRRWARWRGVGVSGALRTAPDNSGRIFAHNPDLTKRQVWTVLTDTSASRQATVQQSPGAYNTTVTKPAFTNAIRGNVIFQGRSTTRAASRAIMPMTVRASGGSVEISSGRVSDLGRVIRGRGERSPLPRSRKGSVLTALYTWDVFSTLDGYGSFVEGADWGGYWGKQGPELLEHRAALFDTEQRMVFGATTFRQTAEIMSSGVICGRTGTSPILGGAGDFDLEGLEGRTLDGHTQELVYRPTPR